MDRKEFKDIVKRVREVAYADVSIRQSIKEIGNAAQDRKRKNGHINEPEMYDMLDDKISREVNDIISELDISWEEIDLGTIDFEEKEVAKKTFLSVIYVDFIGSVTNELILKVQ